MQYVYKWVLLASTSKEEKMNRVYKVIFNRVKGRYEVVSELAKMGEKPQAILSSQRWLVLVGN